MITKNWKDIKSDLNKKIYYPVYLLMGDEPLFIDGVVKIIEDKVLDENEKEFNQTVLYGRETDIPTIISTAKRFPMMANHQVVIVKEAQLLKGLKPQEKKDESDKKEKSKETPKNPLEEYAKNPLKSTILVLSHKYKNLDKRTGLYKAILKNGVVLESNKLYESKVPGWISDYVQDKGYRIGSKGAQLLADHLGNDLSKVVNEVRKVFISLPKGSEITPELIEQNIGISKDFNVFELQKALGYRNSYKAFQIAKYFADNPKSNPMVMTMGALYNYFVKILKYHALKDKSQSNTASALGVPPFFVKDYIQAASRYPMGKLFLIFSDLREADLRSKGVNNNSADHGEILKELIYKILNR